MTSTTSMPSSTASIENEEVAAQMMKARPQAEKERPEEGSQAALLQTLNELRHKIVMSIKKKPKGEMDVELVQSLTNDMKALYRTAARPLDALRAVFSDFNVRRGASTDWDNLPTSMIRLGMICGRILQAHYSLRSKGASMFSEKTDVQQTLLDELKLMQDFHNQLSDLLIASLEICGSLNIPIGEALARRAIQHEVAQAKLATGESSC